MAQEVFAIAAPTTEQLTKTGMGVAGGVIAGVLEGVVVKMAPQLGVLEVPFTWGTLLGVPAIGAAGALFTKGMVSDLFQGVAAFGAGYAASIIPAMIIPEGLFGRRAPAGGQGQLGAGPGVKQLAAGPLGAPQRAQAMAAFSQQPGNPGTNPGTRQLPPGNPGTGQLPANAGVIPIVADETVLV